MSEGVCLWALALLASAPDATPKVIFEPAAEVALVVTSAAPAEAAIARASLERALEAKEIALLRLVNVDPAAGVLGCGDVDQFLCWARAIPGAGAGLRALVILGLSEGRLTGVALHVGRAQQILASPAVLGLASDELDTRIFEGAVTPVEIDAASPSAIAELLTPWFPPRPPLGSLLLSGLAERSRVAIDGRELPVRAEGELEIVAVPAGERRVSIEGASGRREETVAVRPGERAVIAPPGPVVALAQEAAPSPAPGALRPLNVYGGAALVVLGAASLAAGAAASAGAPTSTSLCLPGRCELGARPFAGTGEQGSGLLLAPLGYGLAIAGGTMLGGELLDGERGWLYLALGLGLGAAAYGLSAALGGP